MTVSMTRDWKSPDGRSVQMSNYRDARKWILEEAGRRNLRVAGYERTTIDPDALKHVVDFGDYSVFGLVLFGSESEMKEPDLPPAEEPALPPTREPAKALERVVLGTLPMSVNELELAIHAACDQGRWKWTVRLDGGSLVLEEPFPEGN